MVCRDCLSFFFFSFFFPNAKGVLNIGERNQNLSAQSGHMLFVRMYAINSS